MSDFWAKHLQQTPPAQAPPQPVQQRNVAWWATTPAPQQVTPQPVQQQAPEGYGSGTPASGEQHFGDLLRQGNYTTTRAQSLKDSSTCPECGSGNFIGSTSGAKNGHAPAKRCFECGYNEVFQQSMAGVSAGQNVPIQAARVQQGNTRQADLGRIIQHIS